MITEIQLYDDLLHLSQVELHRKYREPWFDPGLEKPTVNCSIRRLLQLFIENSTQFRFVRDIEPEEDGSFIVKSGEEFEMIHRDRGITYRRIPFKKIEDAMFCWLDDRLNDLEISATDSEINRKNR
jgi:hypothetical protein